MRWFLVWLRYGGTRCGWGWGSAAAADRDLEGWEGGLFCFPGWVYVDIHRCFVLVRLCFGGGGLLFFAGWVAEGKEMRARG